ncbi:MAG: transporter substrate-binding domain-containing protein [Oscillospiraceae bacterium]|nr:transporter substrate-binding domain-containing protein [Oscillospiraceae bacterium]
MKNTLLKFAVIIFPLIFIYNNHVYAENTVKIGYHSDLFINTDDSGKLYGYGIDYLQKVSQTTGLDFEYVRTNDAASALELLDKNEIDMVFPASYSDIPENGGFRLSSPSICSIYGAVFCLDSRGDLFFEDFDVFSHITFGMVEGSAYEPQFRDYSFVHGFTPHIVKFDTSAELAAALADCSIDAAVDNIIRAGNNTKTLGVLNVTECFFAYRRDDYFLSEKINRALYEINYSYPDFRQSLSEKYFSLDMNTSFSREEAEFISSAGVINIGCPRNMRPISYIAENERLSGISPSVLRQLENISGLQFNLVPLPEGSVSNQYLEENSIDMLIYTGYESSEIIPQNLLHSVPYMSIPSMFVCRRGESPDPQKSQRIIVLENSMTLSLFLKNLYPKSQLKYYDNMSDAMDAVKSGDADFLVNDQYSIEYYLCKPKYSTLSIVPFESLRYSTGLAVVTNTNPDTYTDPADSMLINIINKSVKKLDRNAVSRILTAYGSPSSYKFSFDDYIYFYRIYIISFSVILTAAVFLVIYILRAGRKRAAAERENIYIMNCIINALDGIVCVVKTSDGSMDFISSRIPGIIMPMTRNKSGVYSREEYLSIIHPEDADVLNYIFNPENITDTHFSAKFRIACKSGGYIPVLMRCFVSENTDEIYGVITKYC